MDVWSQMLTDLAKLERGGLRRHGLVIDSAAEARVKVAGTEMVCLCSNNYLGLANHPEVRSAAIRAAQQWGVGAGSSRLISGSTGLHTALQDALAEFEGTEAALVTTTGWQANACAIGVIAGPEDLIVADKLCHASIIDAARASGATFRTYRHADTDRLERLLAKMRPGHRRCLIVTDGLFSMDGNIAPLAELADVKDRYDAVLMVDEAHATGVLGPGGRGAAELAGVKDRVDVTVGTLSKALGAVGGFVAGPRALIEMIFNAGRAFIYTTALPASMCAAALAALKLAQKEPARRTNCLRNAARLREALSDAGLDTGPSNSQIIPIMLVTPSQALDLAGRCFEAGFLAPAIRPPTVPTNSARLRVSVMATHDWNDLRRFVDLLTGK